MKLLFLIAAFVLPVCGAIEGVVINKTSGQPQPGVEVTLTTMGREGMVQAGAVKSGPDGKFRIDSGASQMHLIQARYQGVTYNLQLSPNQPATNLTLEVYETSPKVSAMDVEQHMILLEADGQQLVVNETVIFNNDSQSTWYDPKQGTLRFTAPASLKSGADLKGRVLAPGSVPVERDPKPAGNGVWYMDVPVKPGQTRFDISYRIAGTSPFKFEGKILHEPGPVRIVAPQGITVKGDGINPLGTEPQTQAQIFDVRNTAFSVTLEGTGSLRQQGATASAQETAAEEESGPSIATIDPPGYSRQWKLVLGLVLGALILGFWSMYLKGGAPESTGSRRKG